MSARRSCAADCWPLRRGAARRARRRIARTRGRSDQPSGGPRDRVCRAPGVLPRRQAPTRRPVRGGAAATRPIRGRTPSTGPRSTEMPGRSSPHQPTSCKGFASHGSRAGTCSAPPQRGTSGKVTRGHLRARATHVQTHRVGLPLVAVRRAPSATRSATTAAGLSLDALPCRGDGGTVPGRARTPACRLTVSQTVSHRSYGPVGGARSPPPPRLAVRERSV